MNITSTLNEVLVKLFRNITTIEERVIKSGPYKELTINDMHVLEAIDIKKPKNMSSVAKALSVTTGTLTISVNGLVKKGYVERKRSDEDRRVVLISLTQKGRQAYAKHQEFHRQMTDAIVEGLTAEEQEILEKSLKNLLRFFEKINQ